MIFIIIVLLGAKYLSVKVEEQDFKNNETEGNLLVYRSGAHYDLAFTGISHARNFSRYGNHEKMEKILTKKILNIGRGSGTCGVKDQYFYLQYIYKQNVSIDTVVFVISPPYLYAEHLNIDASTLIEEPFRFDFLCRYVMSSSDNKFEKLFHYVRSKYQKSWIEYKPVVEKSKNKRVEKINLETIEVGMESALKDGVREEIYRENIKFLEKSLELVEEHGGVSIIMITPTLFGNWPNTDRMLETCEELEDKFGAKTFNFADSVNQLEYFYDHHHLNTKGVVYFAKKYLIPIFNILG